MTTETPLLKTNLDTNFLKLIAIASMLVDHVGGAFFPEAAWMRCIGRLAFPIFCYCMTVGLLYTHDVKRYLLRLGIFAVVSQPCYILAFHPHNFWAQFTNWNIFCTLFLSLLALYGFQQRKWWLFLAAGFVLCWWNFDYSANGLILMLIFYLCRQRPALGLGLFVLFYLPCLFWGADPASPFTLLLGSFAFNGELCALLAAPLLFCRTSVRPKVNKFVFYVFYPAHLLAIGIVRLALGV